MRSCSLLLLACALLGTPVAGYDWRAEEGKRLPALPDREGFAGSFAGVSGGMLLVAGGANFPAGKPSEGGKKVWYDTVYGLDRLDGAWRVVGKLPRPLGYGVSVHHRDGIVCVGGSDAERHHAEVFRLEWRKDRLAVVPLPALPAPIANACGAILGDVLYIAGGLAKPDAKETLKTLYRIDLAAAEPKWETLAPCPGGARMLSVAAANAGAFWVIGGVDLITRGDRTERRYLTDAWQYQPDKGWTRLAELPRAVTGAPSPAPSDATGIYVLGGDDGSAVGFTPPERHPGFSTKILRYDSALAKWVEAGELAAARVTTPVVRRADLWVIPTGEVRPGVRSPEVWALPAR